MLTSIFYDPVFWLALFAFCFVIGYFYWQEQKEKEKKQQEKEAQLNERIRKLEEKVKEKKL